MTRTKVGAIEHLNPIKWEKEQNIYGMKLISIKM